MADQSRHNTYFIAESTYGTTPTSPTFSFCRQMPALPEYEKSELTSEELYADTQERVSRHGVRKVSRTVPTHLSYGSHEALMESFMQSTFAAGETVTGTTISAVNSTNSYDDSGAGLGDFAAGDLIKVTGFTGNAANNAKSVITTAGASSLVVAGPTLADDAAGESVTITQYDTLLLGTTRKSFTFLDDFADTTTGRYETQTGMEVNSMSIEANPDAIVNVTYELMGQDFASGDSAPGSSSFGSATTTAVFDSFTGIIRENNTDIATVTSLNISGTRNLSEKLVLLQAYGNQPSNGICNITGTITAFFEDNSLLNKFINETSSSLTFSFIDAAGNEYIFHLPSIKYNGSSRPASGTGPVTIELPIRALYDATVGSAMAIGKMDA